MISPEEVPEKIAELSDYLYAKEMQLLGYGESDSSGQWIKLRLPADERDPLEFYRGKKGTTFIVLLVEKSDDEKPVDQDAKGKAERADKIHSGQRLSMVAALMCQNEDFQEYAHIVSGCEMTEKEAKEFMYVTCDIGSRADLDSDEQAAQRFHTLIRKPFLAHRNNLEQVAL